jgi:hypothetical protein
VTRQSHIVILALCAALLGAAALLAIVSSSTDQELVVRQWRLPSVCGFRNLTGLPCPSCGLTRSWVAIAEGNLGTGLAAHRLGWMTMLYVALQALRHAAWLAANRWRHAVEAAGRWLDRGLGFVLLALVVDWIIRLIEILA